MKIYLLTSLFILYYLCVSIACGLLVSRLCRNDETDAEKSGDDHARIGISEFLLGSGFGPFAVGVIHAACLIVFSELPLYFFSITEIIIVASALVFLKNDLKYIAQQFSIYFKGNTSRKLGLLLLLISLGIYGFFMTSTALRPLWHGDTLIYGYEAKDLAIDRSYTARLDHTPTPNARNHIRRTDHPIVYNAFLSAGLAFSMDPDQDLPLRFALQLQNLSLVLTLVGLGLRAGGLAGILAPLFLLFAQYFGALIAMSSRTAFRIIPILQGLGLFRANRSGRRSNTFLFFWVFTFLWSAHTGSLLIAPLLYFCLVILIPRWKNKLLFSLAFLAAAYIGGNHLLVSYFDTNDLLGHTGVYLPLKIIEKTDVWHGDAPPPPGIFPIFERISQQYANDGGVALGLVVFSLVCIFAIVLVKRKSLPNYILASWIFLLIYELIMLGFFDWVQPRFSQQHFTVHRYRFCVYPVSAFLASYVLFRMLFPLPAKAKQYVIAVILVATISGGSWSAFSYWDEHQPPIQGVHDNNTLSLLDSVNSCWGDIDKSLRMNKVDDKELIITDSTSFPWYYTYYNVLDLIDPRLDAARNAETPEMALKFLDDLHVKYIVLNKAKFLSGTAIGKALDSPAFKKIVDCIYDEAYMRVPSP